MSYTNIIPFPGIKQEDQLSGCPLCGKNDGYLNAGAQHWGICKEHKVRWLHGENLFPEWKNQTIAEYLCNIRLLDSYKEYVEGEKVDNIDVYCAIDID